MDFQISMKAARINAGLSQAQVADKIGVSRVTITHWESGKFVPRADQFYKFCEVCNVPSTNVILPQSLL